MELIIEGQVHRICKLFEHESGFRKCEVHVKVTDGEYSEIIPVEFTKELTDEAVGLTVGADIKARCNVRGREWMSKTGEHKAFMSLRVWTYDLPQKSLKEKAMDKAQTAPKTSDMPWDK